MSSSMCNKCLTRPRSLAGTRFTQVSSSETLDFVIQLIDCVVMSECVLTFLEDRKSRP